MLPQLLGTRYITKVHSLNWEKETMLLDITCKTGKLQVLEEGILRIIAPFNKLVWQIPCQAVTKLTIQPGLMMTVNITIYTAQSTYQAEMVTRQNFDKLQALFPHIETGSQPAPPPAAKAAKPARPGRYWYQDPRKLTYIATYTDKKQMQHEVVEAGKCGWIPQSTTAVGGHVSQRKAIAGDALFGSLGLWAGSGRNKDEVIITFVRTPEWLAQNPH
jgi:hypothetical protein